MKNILVSGCSYTQHGNRYNFPYWHEYFTDNVVNVGIYGGSNEQIIMNAQTALLTTQFDEVIIQLSGWDRFHILDYPLHIGYNLNKERANYVIHKDDQPFIDVRDYINPYLVKYLLEQHLTVEKIQNHTLYHLYQLITHCKVNKIKLTVIQGVVPYRINSLARPLYFKYLKNKEIFDDRIICKKAIDNPFFKKIDEMPDNEYIKLIGWPFHPMLGGNYIDGYLPDLEKQTGIPVRVSNISDPHPNEYAHKIIFDIIQRGYYD